jgi:hypothetical protein
MRMVCNRDESRSRPAALPPQVREFGKQRAILPIDPVSGGTWIAASSAGLAMTLLNSYPAPAGPLAPGATEELLESRGTIIPYLLHLADL